MAEYRSSDGAASNKGTGGTMASGVERPAGESAEAAAASAPARRAPIMAAKKAIGDPADTDTTSAEARLSRLARELSARREAESVLREVALGGSGERPTGAAEPSTSTSTAASAEGSKTADGDVADASSYTDRLRRALVSSSGQDAAGEDAGAEGGGLAAEGRDISDRVATIISELKRDGYFDLKNDSAGTSSSGRPERRASVDAAPRSVRSLYSGVGRFGQGAEAGRGLQRQHSDGRLLLLPKGLQRFGSGVGVGVGGRYPVNADDLRVVKMLNVITSSFEDRLDAAVSGRVGVQAELDEVRVRHEAERESWKSEMDALGAERDKLREELESVRRDNARKDEETSKLMSQMTVEMSTLLRKKAEEVEGGGRPTQSLSARSLRQRETEERTMKEFQRWEKYIKEKFEEQGRRSSNSKPDASSQPTNSGSDEGRGKKDAGSPDRPPWLSRPSRRKLQRRTSSAA